MEANDILLLSKSNAEPRDAKDTMGRVLVLSIIGVNSLTTHGAHMRHLF